MNIVRIVEYSGNGGRLKRFQLRIHLKYMQNKEQSLGKHQHLREKNSRETN